MSNANVEGHIVNADQARSAILSSFKTKLPVFLWGPPGIGKSEIVEQITQELGGYMIDLRMAQMEPTDLRGIPFFNRDNGKMDWAPPIDLPDEELASQYPIIVLFLDEMNSAPPSVQAAGYQLTLNRRVGKYRLPDNVVIVAAGNRDSDKGVTYRMPMPLANRFIHVEMKPDFNTWQNWALLNGAHRDVVGYLSFAKQDMYDFDAKSSSRAFATPRSWMYVSKLLDQDETPDTDTLRTLIAGAVGEGMMHKFMAYRKIGSKLPNATDILNGKVSELGTKEISAMYSLTISMCYEMKDIMDNRRAKAAEFNTMFDNFLRFMMDNFQEELVILGGKISLKTYHLDKLMDATKLKNFDEFHKRFGKYVIAASKI
jgi:hypothetical protein